jgi:hypothetical protein
MKLTLEEKLKLAKMHVDWWNTSKWDSNKYNYYLANFKYFCALYKRYGNKTFDNHGQRTKYTRISLY